MEFSLTKFAIGLASNLIGSLVGFLSNRIKRWRTEKTLTGQAKTIVEQDARIEYMKSEDREKERLRETIKKIKHPVEGFKEWKEQDMKRR